MPGGTGKDKSSCSCEEPKQKDAMNAGPDTVGGDELIEKIKGGYLDFEKLICTPSMMVKLSKLGKVLGPKGLMPNPKLGTVTDNVEKSVKTQSLDRLKLEMIKMVILEYQLEKIFSDENLIKNFNAIIETLEKEKMNTTIKGDLIKSLFIT